MEKFSFATKPKKSRFSAERFSLVSDVRNGIEPVPKKTFQVKLTNDQQQQDGAEEEAQVQASGPLRLDLPTDLPRAGGEGPEGQGSSH